MNRIKTAISAMLVAGTVLMPPAMVVAQEGPPRDRQDYRRDQDNDRNRRDWHPPRKWRRYDYDRPEPGQRSYDAARYYRDYRADDSYREHRLGH